MSRVLVVTDSTSDVPLDVASRLNITVVPAYIQVEGVSLRDRVDLSREQFYARLPGLAAAPTTAVPPIDDFVAAYRVCLQEADEVVAILVSEKLSGMCSAARVAASQISERKVHVVDSGQLSMGLGWMVIAAAEAALQGCSASEVLAAAQGAQRRLRLFATLDTVTYLHRSGRISWAAAGTSRLLKIKPILGVVDGEVGALGRTRTRRRAIDRMVEWARAAAPLERLAVLHTMAPEVTAFRKRLTELCNPEGILTVLVTTAIGTHVGPRALGLAAVTAG